MDFARQIGGLATLDEPVRRQLYLFVVAQAGDVSRDEAAAAVDITRGLAGFHLDRLAEAGLLETRFQRLSGKTGPGAGRPSKLYRRSDRQLAVSLPPRSYELAASILASAVDASDDAATRSALHRVAHSVGEQIGATATARAGPRAGKKRKLLATVAELAAHGYEPTTAANEVRMRNCPFHSLASAHKDLVCGMNLALMQGVVTALDVPGVTAALDPKPGLCCVALGLRAR